jgi:hypothetical protein
VPHPRTGSELGEADLGIGVDGTVTLTLRRAFGLFFRDDPCTKLPLSRPPLPSGGHLPRRLALFPVPSEPANGRRPSTIAFPKFELYQAALSSL